MRYSDKLSLIQILSTNTRRQIFKEYREAITHFNYVCEHRNSGSEFHLGDPMHVVFNDAKVYLNLVTIELTNREINVLDIKNVPSLIEAKTQKQIDAEKHARSEAYELRKQTIAAENIAAAQKPAIDAIVSFATFQFNYPNDFIEVAFAGGMVNHLRSKFNSIHHQYGAKAAIIIFWCELDFENRNLLAKYIITSNIK